jgi:hypothetical protein
MQLKGLSSVVDKLYIGDHLFKKNRQKEGTTMRTLVVPIIILVTLFFVSLAGTADLSLNELLQ